MQAPPAYSPPPRKSNTGLIVGLVALGFTICCIVPAGFMFWGVSKVKDIAGPLAGCEFTMAAARGGLNAYAAKNNGKLPPATNWTEAIRPYVPKPTEEEEAVQGFFGKAQTQGANWKCTETTSLVYNTEVAGQDIEKVRGKKSIVLFEAKNGSPHPSGKYVQRPIPESPKIMGKPRGWFSSTIDGPSMVRSEQGEQPFVIRQNRGLGQ